MRIVAGEFGGRRLTPPKGRKIRPTADRVREALFSMIASRVPGAAVLDLFAGTGALGLEALSRGASQAVFVDQDAAAVRLIRANVMLCGVEDRARVILSPMEAAVTRLAAGGSRFDLVFLDPPYGLTHVERALEHLAGVIQKDALVVAEHHAKDTLPDRWKGWLKTRERRYGDTMISLFEWEADLSCGGSSCDNHLVEDI